MGEVVTPPIEQFLPPTLKKSVVRRLLRLEALVVLGELVSIRLCRRLRVGAGRRLGRYPTRTLLLGLIGHAKVRLETPTARCQSAR